MVGTMTALALLALVRKKAKKGTKITRPVSLVGDSYAVGLEHPLRRLEPKLRVPYAKVGATLTEEMRAAIEGEAAKGRVVLTSVGTNGGPGPDRLVGLAMDAMVRGGDVVWLRSPLMRDHRLQYRIRVIDPPELELVDEVHPDADGYAIWAEEIARRL